MQKIMAQHYIFFIGPAISEIGITLTKPSLQIQLQQQDIRNCSFNLGIFTDIYCRL